jgi:hypothetical protein
LLKHLQILVRSQPELAGHAVDLAVDVLLCDGDLPRLTVFQNQPLVDHALQHLFAINAQAFAGQVLPWDLFAVDNCHDLQGLVGGASRGRHTCSADRISSRLGAGAVAGRDLRIGFRSTADHLDGDTGRHHGQSAQDQGKSPPPASPAAEGPHFARG